MLLLFFSYTNSAKLRIHIGLKSLWEVDVVKGVSKKVKLVIVSTYILAYDI